MAQAFIAPIPRDLGATFEIWARAVESRIQTFPSFSIISTTGGPNASGLTGELGSFAVDVGSSATRLWQKFSASTSTTGWSAYSFI